MRNKLKHTWSKKNTMFMVAALAALSNFSFAQVFMDADSTGNAYARITSKGYNYEVPDCGHPVVHIIEQWDSSLRKNVFVFTLHRDLDNDRCINFDRQRCEMKTDGGSPADMKGSLGETHTYRWKFKLDAGFQPSSSFTHIHQLKAGDGTVDTDNPLITITPRKGSPNKLEIIHISPVESGGVTTKVMTVDLSSFMGEWVEAYETVTYSLNGSYSLQIKRLRDDVQLLTYSNSNIALWRTGITFVRPKYGIYRSLDHPTDLRDESVRFADFYLAEGTTGTVPSAPSDLIVLAASSSQVDCTWTDISSDESQFRIDRSTNGTVWSYLATVPANTASYSDTGLQATTKYYYRVRAENTFGNSLYSNSANATTLGATSAQSQQFHPKEYSLHCFPNPFNPSTKISYELPSSGFVIVKIIDLLGKEVVTLVHREEPPGRYQVEWNASAYPSGVYFCLLQAANYSDTIKILYLR